jgi:hypothetical protein
VSSLTLILYLLILIPIVLIWWAQSRVRRVFRQEDQAENAEQITGLEAARELLDHVGLQSIRVEMKGRPPADYYDPVTKTLVLSLRTARRDTALAVGVAGHEVGHAIQDAQGYPLMRLHVVLARWLIALSTISPFAFIGGFLLGSVFLMWVAIGILALQVIFALTALPLELNASKRAIALLEREHVIVLSEEASVRRVLRAASYTYLASVAMRVAVFLFWFILLSALTGVQTPF